MASALAGIRLSDSVSRDLIARMFPIEEILRRSYRLLPTKILAPDEGVGCTIDRPCRITGDFDRIGTRAHVRVGIDFPIIANQMFSD